MMGDNEETRSQRRIHFTPTLSSPTLGNYSLGNLIGREGLRLTEDAPPDHVSSTI